MHVAIVIPALNEAATIGTVVRELRAASSSSCDQVTVLVGDNGSTDQTAAEARDAGAVVARADVRGYGAACLAALAQMPPGVDAVLFADGDGSDDPADVPALLAPVTDGPADLVIGSRALGQRLGWVEPGALTGPQRFGNALSATLLQVGYGVQYSDLGPFRAVRRPALERMAMDDMNFGWTVQMQARAARLGLCVRDVPVHYRRRAAGTSKVSGNLKGSVMAGAIILRTLAQEVWWRPGRG